MTKKEVCALLSISPKTLERRMARGVYKFTRTGEGQYAPVSFTYADLGLPEPEPEPVICPQVVGTSAPESSAHPEPAPDCGARPAPSSNLLERPEPSITESVIHPEPTRPLDPIEAQRQSDLAFAEAYKRGDATDSAGNRIDGTNAERPTLGQTSLLGPSVDATQRPAIDTQAHTDPALIGASDAINAPRHSFDRGLSDDDLAAMRSDWRRRGGGPSMSEQREAIERSKANINAAFDYARGRYSR